jgi:hypothetical protein
MVSSSFAKVVKSRNVLGVYKTNRALAETRVNNNNNNILHSNRAAHNKYPIIESTSIYLPKAQWLQMKTSMNHIIALSILEIK